jgi:hypothetical protein
MSPLCLFSSVGFLWVASLVDHRLPTNAFVGNLVLPITASGRLLRDAKQLRPLFRLRGLFLLLASGFSRLLLGALTALLVLAIFLVLAIIVLAASLLLALLVVAHFIFSYMSDTLVAAAT